MPRRRKKNGANTLATSPIMFVSRAPPHCTASYSNFVVGWRSPLFPLPGARRAPPHALHISYTRNPRGECTDRSGILSEYPKQPPCLIRRTIFKSTALPKLHHTQKPKNLFQEKYCEVISKTINTKESFSKNTP